jgi:predicted outer membrane repeat protein
MQAELAREQIAHCVKLSRQHPQGDTINFSLPANSTITLTSGELLISKDITITGPGARTLTISGNNASRIFRVVTASAVVISELTIANGNSGSGVSGGAIHNSGTQTLLTLLNCAFLNNSGGSGGAVANEGILTVNTCTFAGNRSTGHGGALRSTKIMFVRNSTFHNNEAVSSGAITSLANPGGGAALSLRNCTITGNRATDINGSTGGGVLSGSSSTTTLRNTLVAHNTAATGTDLSGSFTSEGYNLVRSSSGATVTPTTGDQIGTPSAANPLLGELQNNGGPTDTRALLPGSPAIDKGHASGLNTDQRGFARPVDSPSIDNASSGDGSDIGAYEVQADQLAGCNGGVYQVQNNNDSGAGSLRAGIQAVSVCQGTTITFAPSVRGVITLTSGELLITRALNIIGPGANLLAIQRDAGASQFRIFEITDFSGNPRFPVTISGLTIANGFAHISGGGESGGGIANLDGSLTVSGCVLSGNSGGTGSGGGIANYNNTLTITNSTITGNTTNFAGGGIYSKNGKVTIANSTISGNTANGGGGGIFTEGAGGAFSDGSEMTITNSTISGNMAPGGGPGGGIFNQGVLNITNSTLSGNAGSIGGGLNNRSGVADLIAVTITGNSGSLGGGIAMGGPVNARSTIIALNTADTSPDMNGTLVSKGFNLIGNSSGVTIQPGPAPDQVGVTAAELNLGPLQDNGGPTRTHALLTGSRAIDKGHSSSLTIDQRDLTRPFDDLIPNASGSDGSDVGAFEVQASGLVANVATRLPVGTGDNVLIEGFIVLGPNGSTKKIIVRALGPFLIPFGIPDALPNPTLEIRDSTNTVVATNNDWRNTQVGGIITGDQAAEIEGSNLAPTNDLESAIIADLAPSSYTAVVRGANNSVGTAIVDAYDLSPASPARLANVATRGLIRPFDQLMIAGFTIQSGDVRAVARAIGPSLSAFGINNALPDTTLQLRDVNGGIVRENDDWQSDQKVELETTGLQPGNPLEAAIVATLPPGQYTAQVRGKPETTGIGVVEIYFLQ